MKKHERQPNTLIGKNIANVRVLFGLTQSELAGMVDISKQALSHSERVCFIKEPKLTAIAKALDVTPELIRKCSDDGLLVFIETLPLHLNSSVIRNDTNFNAFDKVIELYERLLQMERDKVEHLRSRLSQLAAFSHCTATQS
jgi:transcriptional regulator with XRE-family HTH domain